MGIEKMIAIALGLLVLIVGAFIVADALGIIGGGEPQIDNTLCAIQNGECVTSGSCADGEELLDISCGEGYVCCQS